MTKKWLEVRHEIKRLYLTERKTLEEVRRLMKENHDFDASRRAYKSKIDEWGWQKYKKDRHLGSCNPVARQTRDLGTELSPARCVASPKAHMTTFEGQMSLIQKKKKSLHSLQGLANQNDTNENNVERIQILSEKIEDVCKSLEGILAAVAQQINSPAGFASCWKQQPMILEDAHGTFIPIPLDVVVSWDIFDKILGSHFSTLPGAKKVARCEYAIEDSGTQEELSRDSPWISHSKPGLKIDMSMIFRDKSKTTVVCPKCDTISNQRKGVMVECQNPICKMLFRTEEDDDEQSVIPTSVIGLEKEWQTILELWPHTVSGSCRDDAEEKPGLFKRVIIRIPKINFNTVTNTWDPGPGSDPTFDYSCFPEWNLNPPWEMEPVSILSPKYQGLDKEMPHIGSFSLYESGFQHASDIFSSRNHLSTHFASIARDRHQTPPLNDQSTAIFDRERPGTFVPSLNTSLKRPAEIVLSIAQSIADEWQHPQPQRAERRTLQSSEPLSVEQRYSTTKLIGNSNERPHLKDNTESLIGDMSWAGVSAGGWIRDESVICKISTSMFSDQSTYYLPKAEANFMRDFECCGEALATLHELLQHNEEVHANYNSINDS